MNSFPAGSLCVGPNVHGAFGDVVNCADQDKSSLINISQRLWPDHCISGVSSGPTSSQFSSLLVRKSTDVVVQKGIKCGVCLLSVLKIR